MALSNSLFFNLVAGINLRIKKTFTNPYRAADINWLSLKYLKHLPANKVHSHKLFQHSTFFYGGLEYLHGVREIFLEGVYNQVLPENSLIIDCGAHIGLSVIYLKKLCPTARILCFEPDEKNFDLLQKNIASHHLKNVDARNEAVWTEDTILNFVQEGSMGSKIASENRGNTISVNARRLKSYLDKKVDFLKIDIEGAEYAVLKDIAGSLYNVTKMFVEYHGTFSQNSELIEIFHLIKSAGFKFYIKEAAPVYVQPFLAKTYQSEYDIQLNIFCFR